MGEFLESVFVGVNLDEKTSMIRPFLLGKGVFMFC